MSLAFQRPGWKLILDIFYDKDAPCSPVNSVIKVQSFKVETELGIIQRLYCGVNDNRQLFLLRKVVKVLSFSFAIHCA